MSTDRAGRASAQWRTLDEFRGRAEDVLTSDFARNYDLATVGSSFKIFMRVQEGIGSRVHHVDWDPGVGEAVTEAAAARLRPLFLQNDPVYHGKVTNAISDLAQGAPEQIVGAIKQCKSAWRGHDRSTRWAIAVADDSAESGRWFTDRQIASDFIYGYLVHHTVEARERVTRIPPAHRLRAMTLWVADALLLTQGTKQLVVDIADAGLLAPRST